MPTYQYACTACGHHLEAVQAFSAEPLTVCPACEGRLRKLFGSVGVVFKGSGFYRNDSRSESKPTADSAPKTSESTSPSKSDKSDPSKSTTTPATTTTATTTAAA